MARQPRRKGIVAVAAGLVSDAVDALTGSATAQSADGDHTDEPLSHSAADAADRKADYERAALNRVAHYRELPAAGGLQLRFANGSEFVTDAIDVDRSSLKSVSGPRVTYARDADFNPHADPARVSEAWLIAANGEAVRCEVGIGGVPVGGGQRALIRADSLIF